MTAVSHDTMGGHIKAGILKRQDADVLARALFDGKRPLKIGGVEIVTPAYDGMTAHERIIVAGLFLKAKVRP